MKISYLELLEMIRDNKQPKKIKYIGGGEIYIYKGCGYYYYGKVLNEIIVSLYTEKEMVYNKLIEIIEEPILTDKEKEYLSAVIKPFRNKVLYLEKSSLNNGEYLTIATDDVSYSYLPVFKIGEYYKGMELGKSYTLEELDL